MKILSIDFDYFQNVTKEIIQKYPNGIDRDIKQAEKVWKEQYKKYSEIIKQASIRDKELDYAKQIIENQDRDTPAMICNSHVNIVDFINTISAPTEKVNIVHIDMHHDMFNDNPNLDCGNWISHLEKERSISFMWIANPITEEVYGISDLMTPFKQSGRFNTSLQNLKDTKFDAVFLCRSDNWFPPHLDKFFVDFCSVLKQKFGNMYLEHNIDKSRSISYEKGLLID